MASIIPFSEPEKNIIATIVWFDLFEYPLTLEELERFCLGKKNDPIEKVTIEKTGKELINNGKIDFRNGYYFLKGRAKIIETRIERSLIAKKLWKKVESKLPWLGMVPFIKMAAVCNTLAFNNPTSESDIDLFIITEKKRLFITRTLSTLLFHLLGIRRHGNKIAGRFCLSFYISEESMDLEKIKLENDIYLAYWMRTLKPKYGKESWNNFLNSNRWLEEFLPYDNNANFEETPINNFISISRFFSGISKTLAWTLNGRIGDILENWIFQIQKKRHLKRKDALSLKSSIIIERNMLKFHNIDRRKEYREQFFRKFYEVLKENS